MSNLGSSFGGVSSAHAGYSPSHVANPAPTEKEQFEGFVKNELAYHKSMAEMYERLLANSLLTNEDDGASTMLRTLIVAGMHQLAGHVK